MRKLILATGMAVVGAIASNSAMAFGPAGPLGGYQVILNATGSSAFRDAFRNTLPPICDTTGGNTVDEYGVKYVPAVGPVQNAWDTSPYTGPDFRAYSCLLKSTLPAGFDASLQGKSALIYYRSEGGSVWGYGPEAKQIAVNRLVVDGNCTQSGLTTLTSTVGSATVSNWICPVNGTWSLDSDSVPAPTGVVNLTTDQGILGVTDLEKEAHTGENWSLTPSGANNARLGAEPSTAQRNAVTSATAFGQVFQVYISQSAGTNATVKALTNLGKQTLASIFSGTYTNWNQVPETAGVASTPIVLCRRDAGSGTQTIASIYFLDVYCGTNSAHGTPLAFRSGASSTNIYNNTTGDMDGCVAGHDNAIGFRNVGSATGTKAITINGETASKANMVNGNYGYWQEVQYNLGPAYAALPGTSLVKLLADGLLAYSIDATTGTVAGNTAFIPLNGTSGNTPVIPATNIMLGTRGGNSCATPTGLN